MEILQTFFAVIQQHPIVCFVILSAGFTGGVFLACLLAVSKRSDEEEQQHEMY